MNRKEFITLAAVTAVSGFFGGMAADLIFSSRSISARDLYIPPEPPTMAVVPNGGFKFTAPDGRVLARIKENTGGGARMEFYNDPVASSRAVSIGTGVNGGFIEIGNRSGDPVAMLSAVGDTSSLTLHNSNTRQNGVALTTDRNGGKMTVVNSDGKMAVLLRICADGGGDLLTVKPAPNSPPPPICSQYRNQNGR